MDYIITKKDLEEMSSGKFLTIDGGNAQYRAEKPPNRNCRFHILSLHPEVVEAFTSIQSTLPQDVSNN